MLSKSESESIRRREQSKRVRLNIRGQAVKILVFYQRASEQINGRERETATFFSSGGFREMQIEDK